MICNYQRIEVLLQENEQLRRELAEANSILHAIRHGEVDALLLSEKSGDEVYILKGADHIYRVLVEEMQEGYVVVAFDGTVLFCNKNFAEIIKTPLERAIGSSIYNLLKPQDMETFTWLLSERQGIFKTEFKLKAGDGFCVPVLASANSVTIDQDIVACIVVTDLTEQRRNERFAQMIFNQAKEVVIVCDRFGRVMRANPAALKLFGDSLIGNDFDATVPLSLEHDGTTFILNQIIDRNLLYGVEVNFSLQEDKIFSFLVNVGRLSDEEGDNILGHIVTMTDITENRRFTREITRLDRLSLIGEMAAGIGHEVRNPMTTVRGYLQLFRERTQFTNFKESFDVMIQELDRANEIISDFLSLAKNKTVKLQPTHLNTVIENIFPLIQADAFRRGNDIDLDLTEIPWVLADEKEIRQCILNLVRNGLEAMINGGTITIRTRREENRIMLVIQDQGPGIPSDVRDKLGTPFFTTKEQGTGLGLPVCFSIAERHRAKIDVDTSPVGTTFYLIFNNGDDNKICEDG